jgi:hypothetical protein
LIYSRACLKDSTGDEIKLKFDKELSTKLNIILCKRNAIVHNNGLIDGKYKNYISGV